MSPVEWAGLAVAVTTIVTAFVGSVRWLVKHYLSELVPNSGKSMKDQITRLEERVDQIMLLLIQSNEKPRKTFKPKGE